LAESNRSKWEAALLGKSNYEAFRIIWNPRRDLTPKQRKALTELHKRINMDTEVLERFDQLNKLF